MPGPLVILSMAVKAPILLVKIPFWLLVAVVGSLRRRVR